MKVLEFLFLLIIYQISNLLYLIINSQFPELPLSHSIISISHLIDHITPKLEIKLVKWKRPNYNELKLNVDGCSKGNPGSAGGGGVLRDHAGQMIMAFSAYFGFCSKNSAEALALKTGLRWCLDHDFHRVAVESDSLLIIQMVKGMIDSPWHMKDDIKQIQSMSSLGDFSFIHTFREGNTTADLLANMAEHCKTTTFFTEAINLPSKVTSTLNNDVVGKPNIRIRVKKGNFIFDPS